MKKDGLKAYKNKKTLILGGLGFLGSNLAHLVVATGAKVTILDNLDSLYGGNNFNIKGIEKKVKLVNGDSRDEKLIVKLVKDADIIFDFAAQVSPIDSGGMPFEDLDANSKAHLILLEACREHNPHAKILFSSSRLVLGKVTENPVTEDHPAEPLNLYGVHKLAAEKYFRIYHANYGIRTVVFRITNPYGERQQLKHGKYGVPGWFLRQAMENKPIEIFGKGTQTRDYIYILDLVRAFALAGLSPNTDGNLYNCGSGKSVRLRDMAEMIIKTAGKGSIVHVPWPSHYDKEETGSFESDISKLKAAIGWEPETSLEEGLAAMIRYYNKHKDKYAK